MLLTAYDMEIFRPKCNPGFESVHCIAHFRTDISEVLPYLNAVLMGDVYVQSPPSVTFRAHGKLITVHARSIAINALKDREEAEKILEWLKGEINDAWEKREEIQPRYHGISKPKILEVLKLLPKTNCKECGQPTCLVFATLVTEGAKGPRDCPKLEAGQEEKLERYLEAYDFEN